MQLATRSACKQSLCGSPARSLGSARRTIACIADEDKGTFIMLRIVDVVRFSHVKGKWQTLGLVKWKGWYRASDNTWKNLEEINDEKLLAQASTKFVRDASRIMLRDNPL
eukprot:3170737-Pleurochrysis_carterae.AAC.1